MPEELFVLESLPEDVKATIEARDRALAALGSAGGGLEFIVDNLRRWIPGSTVKVAFLGGSTELHQDIADTVIEPSRCMARTKGTGAVEQGLPRDIGQRIVRPGHP